jgi:hypothetical protein
MEGVRVDLTYLKKRAAMLGDAKGSFGDDKVQTALAKIIPPPIVPAAAVPENNGYECVVPNKLIRNWIDLIPEDWKSFIRFIYVEGDDYEIEKYIRLAMTDIAWKSFQSYISKDQSDSDLFLMRHLIWHSAVLGRPVGIDFGVYEMNMIFANLPIDVSKDKIKAERIPFADFYKQIKYAEWGLQNAS